jgi:iron complex transport system permease protein
VSPPPLDFGHHTVVVRKGSWSLRARLRSVVSGAALVTVAGICGLVALGIGSYQVSVVDVLRALLGYGPEQIQTLVVDWRLSRVVLGTLVGCCLGVSGAVFQSLTRNPLGSPDVVGFTSGAYTGALATIILVGTGQRGVVTGAICGGIVTALSVYLLAYRRGVQGFRLIVVGIAITAMLSSVNTYLLLHTDLWRAQLAAVWGAGSLNGLDWSEVWAVAAVMVVVLPLVAMLAPRLSLLELGDDAAASLGVRVERSRLALVVLAVSLVAVTSAVAGPITFVALAAPHIARRVTSGSGVQLAASGLVGAVLVVVCDVVAQQVLAPVILPVGLVTIVLGGGYLTWLLGRHARRGLA